MADTFGSDWCISPAKAIRQIMQERGITRVGLSRLTSWSTDLVMRVLNDETEITPQMADDLDMALCVPAKLWRDLESLYLSGAENWRTAARIEAKS